LGKLRLKQLVFGKISTHTRRLGVGLVTEGTARPNGNNAVERT